MKFLQMIPKLANFQIVTELSRSIFKFSNFQIILILVLFVSCEEHFTPKPREYFRITLPEHKYKLFDSLCPFSFEYPIYATVSEDKNAGAEPYWLNIKYKKLNCIIHLSYKNVKKDLNKFMEDSRTLAYKHTIKADAINEKVYEHPKNQVFGILYDIKGNAASSVQFFVTDTTKHFFRGSLYFNVKPNKDSLAPVIEFVKQDIIHLMETLKWK